MHLEGDLSDLNNRVQIHCECPGQTMMVALSIMINFEDLHSASGKGNTFARALECGKVPGAGDAVHNALSVLETSVAADLDASTVIRQLHNCWCDYAGHHPCYADRVSPGLDKASDFESDFVALWDAWKSRSI